MYVPFQIIEFFEPHVRNGLRSQPLHLFLQQRCRLVQFIDVFTGEAGEFHPGQVIVRAVLSQVEVVLYQKIRNLGKRQPKIDVFVQDSGHKPGFVSGDGKFFLEPLKLKILASFVRFPSHAEKFVDYIVDRRVFGDAPVFVEEIHVAGVLFCLELQHSSEVRRGLGKLKYYVNRRLG